jgi:hypothetical protein
MFVFVKLRNLNRLASSYINNNGYDLSMHLPVCVYVYVVHPEYWYCIIHANTPAVCMRAHAHGLDLMSLDATVYYQ